MNSSSWLHTPGRPPPENVPNGYRNSNGGHFPPANLAGVHQAEMRMPAGSDAMLNAGRGGSDGVPSLSQARFDGVSNPMYAQMFERLAHYHLKRVAELPDLDNLRKQFECMARGREGQGQRRPPSRHAYGLADAAKHYPADQMQHDMMHGRGMSKGHGVGGDPFGVPSPNMGMNGGGQHMPGSLSSVQSPSGLGNGHDGPMGPVGVGGLCTSPGSGHVPGHSDAMHSNPLAASPQMNGRHPQDGMGVYGGPRMSSPSSSMDPSAMRGMGRRPDPAPKFRPPP